MRNNTKRGFTLVELLVTISIIAVLTTVSVVGYVSFVDRTNDSKALTELTQIRDWAISYDIAGADGNANGEIEKEEAKASIDNANPDGVIAFGYISGDEDEIVVRYAVSNRYAYWILSTGEITLECDDFIPLPEQNPDENPGEIPEPTHNCEENAIDIDSQKDPTCSAEGLTAGKKCSVCDKILVEQKSIPKIAHTYDNGEDSTCNVCGYERNLACVHTNKEVIPGKDATCTETGLTAGERCLDCEEITVPQDDISALGHDRVNVVEKPATCTEDGYCAHTACSRCDYKDGYEIIPAKGHQNSAATCTEAGTCTVCGTQLEAAQGHEYNDVVTAPTCITEGYTTHTCSRCGDSYKDNEIAALDHEIKILEAKDPTCTTTGLTEGQMCTRCNVTLVKQEEIPATGHTKISHDAKAPTCTEVGWDAYETCSKCDYTTKVEKPVLQHVWGWVEDKPATVTEAGYGHEECSLCHEKRNENTEIPKLDHNCAYVGTVTTEPTCTTTGTKTFVCSICGHTKTEDIATIEHNYLAVVTAPTCDKAGYTTHTCSVCGHSYTDSEVAALSHVWKFVEDVKPTYTTTGLGHDECSVCGAKKNIDTPIDAITCEHSYTSVVTTEPTCTTTGVETFTCSKCNGTYTEGIASLGHDVVNHDAKAPTCTEKGWEAYETCSRCDHTTYREKVALNHSYNSVVTPAQCGVKGYTTYTCTRCGDSYKDDETAALEHNWEVVEDKPASYTETGLQHEECSLCHEKRNEGTVIPVIPHDHVYNSKTTKEPTCTATGIKTLTCSLCGDTKTEDIAKIDHSYSTVVTPPTCDVDGYTTYTCACGDTYKDNTVAATGHAWSWVEDKAPTYTATGLQHEECSVCHTKRNEGTVIPVKTCTHSYTSVVTTAPTCTTTGIETFTCSECGDTYTQGVTALGHDEVPHDAKAPTCTEKGWDAYVTCSRCDHTTKVEKAALDHNYQAVVTPAKCGVKGYTTHTCSRCGDSYTDNETAALNHSYTNYVSDNNATCTADGTKTATCNNGCGTKNTVTDTGTKLPHTYASATCFAPQTCSCGATTGTALTHKYTNYVSDNNATCTADGTKSASCDHGCGTKDTVADTGTKLPHTYASATCTAPKTCSVCGTTTGEALGHSWSSDYTHLASDVEKHYHPCTRTGCTEIDEGETHSYNTNGVCVCGMHNFTNTSIRTDTLSGFLKKVAKSVWNWQDGVTLTHERTQTLAYISHQDGKILLGMNQKITISCTGATKVVVYCSDDNDAADLISYSITGATAQQDGRTVIFTVTSGSFTIQNNKTSQVHISNFVVYK